MASTCFKLHKSLFTLQTSFGIKAEAKQSLPSRPDPTYVPFSQSATMTGAASLINIFMSRVDKISSFICPHHTHTHTQTLFVHKRSSLKTGEVANPLGMALPSQAPGRLRLHMARSDNNSICAYVHLYAQLLAPDLQYINKTRLHIDSVQNRFIPFQCQIQFCSLRWHYLELQFSSIFNHR